MSKSNWKWLVDGIVTILTCLSAYLGASAATM